MKKNMIIWLLPMMLLLIPFASAEVIVSDIDVQKFGQYDSSYSGPNGVLATFTMENVGSTTETGIIEIAFQPSQLLSFFSPLKTCDADFPYNTHREYELAPGEKTRISLSNYPNGQNDAGNEVPDGKYRVVLTHMTACSAAGGEPKDPFGWGYAIGVYEFGDKNANAADQCDNDGQALEYVQDNGVPACIQATCSNPASTTSIAGCDKVDGAGDGFDAREITIALAALVLIGSGGAWLWRRN